jgi:hypothetical protein
MNNGFKVGMALAGAAAIAVGGTAFTASNSVPDNIAAGYGDSTVTGVNYSEMVITPAANPINLGTVTYKVTGDGDVADVSTAAGWSYVLSNAGVVVDAACSATDETTYTLVTCTPDATTEIVGLTTIGLTATQQDPA